MSDWQRRAVPPICERLIGFSIPQNNSILVISYEGVHLLHLGADITVKTDEQFSEYDIYDPNAGIAQYLGNEYQIIGLHNGTPILDSPAGERLELNTKKETLSISQKGRTVFSMRYSNVSGDWVAATFSADGNYLVLGCPYDFDFVVLERNNADEFSLRQNQ